MSTQPREQLEWSPCSFTHWECCREMSRQHCITPQLREIISELDARLTKEDLDGIIEEIDEDGSGTMDFDEFCQMMMS